MMKLYNIVEELEEGLPLSFINEEDEDNDSEESKEKVDALNHLETSVTTNEPDENDKLPQNISQEYSFNVQNKFLLEKAIETIKKMSKKFKIQVPEIIVGQPFKKGLDWDDIWGQYSYYVDLIPVKIIVKDIFQLPDYKVLGVVDNVTGGVVTFGDEKVPSELLTPSQKCDLCNTNRQRGKSWVVKQISTGEFKRFGGDCVKKAFGINPMKYIAALDFFRRIQQTVGDEFEEKPTGPGRRISPLMRVIPFDIALTVIKHALDEKGYVKKEWGYTTNRWGPQEKYRTNSGNATADLCEEIMLDRDKIIAVKPDHELVEGFKKYWENYTIENNDTSFGQFLLKIKDFIKENQFRVVDCGMMIYAMHDYEKNKDKKKEDTTKSNEFIGKVGEKIEFHNIKLVGHRTFQSQFGLGNLWLFVDDKGNSLKKFGELSMGFYVGSENGQDKKNQNDDSEHNPEVGDLFTFFGEIKKHETYNGINSTLIGRVSQIPKKKKVNELSPIMEQFNRLINYGKKK